ncbi:RDD family protein [Virgibacillus ndiopensis]|uniref:RDD family protein n=1 Tax=Virgibacillus ndiopensis TaxID=2004408 RepID=UPI000C084CE2|nr:RDD family protein [Virgibacillus ndiopensis]
MEVTNPAGFQNRFLATGIISQLLYGVFYDSENYHSIDYIRLIYGLILPVVWYGYTLGRRMAGNRIVRIDGRKVDIGTMILRNIVAGIFYILTLGIGLIVSAFMIGGREDKRAIHDFIAQTYVTTDPPSKTQ